MIFGLYSVHDALSTYGDVTVQMNDAIALRSFKNAVNSIPQFKDNPHDYALYRVGAFDSESGQILTEFVPETSGTVDPENLKVCPYVVARADALLEVHNEN